MITRALLLCPSDRPALDVLARSQPLALLPVCGRSVLDLWLTDLASRGVREVRVLAADRPDRIRAAVGRGERWGVQVEVVPEAREWTEIEARQRHPAAVPRGCPDPDTEVILVDRLPGGEPWRTPRDWFREVLRYFRHAQATHIGFREMTPGVFVNVRARIATTAVLEAPCWVGAQASVGQGSRVGPESVIEDGAFVDEGASVTGSLVGPGTYVGAMTEVRDSLAWGRGLYKWDTGSFTEVTDAFLLGEVRTRAHHKRPANWIGRLAAAAALGVLSPLVLVAAWRQRGHGPLFRIRQAVRAPVDSLALAATCPYYELNGVTGLWRRWPELWNVVRGEFAWVGNRPLTREQLADLGTDFERLWVAVPPGVISLADAEGCRDSFDDEARAHASYYAVRNDRWTDARILARAFGRARSVETCTLKPGV